MSKSRRSVAIDEEIVEELSKFSDDRGMTLAGYIRSMFISAIQAERSGFYPPNMLKEALGYETLKRLGFIFVPVSILDAQSEEEIENLGKDLGKALAELSPKASEIFERYALSLKIAFPRGSSLLILPSRNPESKLRSLLIGMAIGLGLKIEKEGEIVIVRLGDREPQ